MGRGATNPQDPPDFIARCVDALDTERRRRRLSIKAFAALMPGVAYSTVYRTVKRQTTPDFATLTTMAAAVGMDLPSERAAYTDARDHGVIVDDRGERYGRLASPFDLPVVAEATATSGDVELLFDPGELPEAHQEGPFRVRVRGESLFPLAADGQFAIVDPGVHPDTAPAHPDFPDPIALAWLDTGAPGARHVVKRWHRHDREHVRLITVNRDVVDNSGLPRHEDVRAARPGQRLHGRRGRQPVVRQAWTVRGVFWW